MEKVENKKRKLVIISLIIFVILLSTFICFGIYDYKRVSVYKNKVFYNIYLDEFNLEKNKLDDLDKVLDSYSEKILSKNIKFIINNKEYTYKYSDLGLSINKKDIIDEIKEYQNKLNYFDKVSSLNHKTKKVFEYKFLYNEDTVMAFVNNLKSLFDVKLVNGQFVMNDNRELSYALGTDSYSLNVEESYKEIVSNINKKDTITLIGTSEKAVNNESYKLVDTKVSSFSTEFNPYISRATNLKTALAYIDGAIINPGEVFSFYKYAGPYNKKGYVFYYEFVGNGVCQIATTVYNAALLGGLEIVKRYPHDKKSVYVAGGLDATVASYASGWNVDFQFKNTYKYPIYISAYVTGGVAHVDFWSNSNAKEGKTYTTESVKTGSNSYKTYLHTYQNGVEISKSFIASTWYTKY